MAFQVEFLDFNSEPHVCVVSGLPGGAIFPTLQLRFLKPNICFLVRTTYHTNVVDSSLDHLIAQTGGFKDQNSHKCICGCGWLPKPRERKKHWASSPTLSMHFSYMTCGIAKDECWLHWASSCFKPVSELLFQKGLHKKFCLEFCSIYPFTYHLSLHHSWSGSSLNPSKKSHLITSSFDVHWGE